MERGGHGERAARTIDVDGVVHGVRLAGRVPEAFGEYLWSAPGGSGGGGAVELAYADLDAPPPAVEELWASEPGESEAPERFGLSRLPDGFLLTVGGGERGNFRCTPRRIGIEWSGSAAAAAHHLFTYALPLWLETRGVPVLHGAAVEVGGRAVGFLAPTGAGKSVLCAELVRLGCGFLADDGLALERGGDGAWRCPAGPPLLRLWPSGLVRRLEVAPEPLAKVRGSGDKRRLPLARIAARGAVAPPARPLAAFYVLRRRAEPGAGVEISALSPREALVRLLEHGVAAAPASALGLAEARLALLAEIAGRVPVKRLSFPSGTDSAPRVLAAIEAGAGRT
jgi:hypothetical protein